MRSTGGLVEAFLNSIPNEQRLADARHMCALMQEITGEPAEMWGTSIVGFGRYHYRYASGHEGDSALASFSPRKEHLVVCIWSASSNREMALRELIHRSVRVRQGVNRAST